MSQDKSKKTIAIIRGGEKDYHKSLSNGANVLHSLSKYIEDINLLDVVVEVNKDWYERGIPSDAHKVFSKADYYIDFTNDFNSDYHKLAEKLDVKIIFENNFTRIFSRLNTKRILNQIGFNISKYVVFRDDKNLENKLKDIWLKFHTPILIKDGNHIHNKKSILTYSFLEAFNYIKKILSHGHEAILEEHIDGDYVSIAIIPNYRGEEFYIPTPIESIDSKSKTRIVQGKSLKDKYIIDHDHHKRGLVYIDEAKKKLLKQLAKEVYNSLGFDHHIMIDLSLKDNNLKILDIHVNPHTFKGSRFDFILENSGVDMGKFILDRIEKIEEEKLIF